MQPLNAATEQGMKCCGVPGHQQMIGTEFLGMQDKMCRQPRCWVQMLHRYDVDTMVHCMVFVAEKQQGRLRRRLSSGQPEAAPQGSAIMGQKLR